MAESGEEATVTSDSFDPIPPLMENCESGVLSRIWYQKRPPMEPGPRLIAPRHLVSGVGALLIRAVQYEPERGVRHFCVNKIIRVEATDVAGGGDASFTTGELHAWRSGTGGARVKRPIGQLCITTPESTRSAMQAARVKTYIELVRDAVLDLQIEPHEAAMVDAEREKRDLTLDEVRAAHAYVFAEFLLGFVSDGKLDCGEEETVEQLLACLDELGWRPG